VRYARLDGTEIEVSRLALGTMQFGWTATKEESFATLDRFLDAGGTLIDTADIYSNWAPGNPGGVSEQILGEWLASRGVRDRVVLATKVRGRMWDGPDGEGLSRAHILRAAEGSLERLRTDRIDLYQCHWPDERVPIEETLSAFGELMAAGRVRAIGCSNFTAAELRHALDVAAANGLPRFVSLQPHYNLVHRHEFEAELQALCAERGLAVLPYSPLASGFLTGKYRPNAPPPPSQRARAVAKSLIPPCFRVLDEVERIARDRGVSPGAVAIAWLLAQPTVTSVIIGANTPGQLEALLPAADLDLDEEELTRLNEVSRPFAEGDPVRRR